MKRHVAISILMLLGMVMNLPAQDFSIVGADAKDYPRVAVDIEVPGSLAVTKDDFKLYENGKEVDFEFFHGNDSSAGSGKAICFLIEASGFTYGSAVENFKKAVAEALQTLGPNDQVDVCWFGKANSDGRALNTVSAEFTSDKDLMAGELKSKIVAWPDTNRVSDVFKGIYECLDFMHSKSNLPSNKVIIVLSAAINNSRSPIRAEDCIEKANSFQIPIYTLTYKTSNRYAADNFVRISDQTKGESRSAKTQVEISDAIQGFYSSIDEVSNVPFLAYVIEFLTTQDNDTNRFEIRMGDQKLEGSFVNPEASTSFWKRFMVWIIIGIVLIVAAIILIVWFLMRSAKNKKAQADKTRATDERQKLMQQQLNVAKETKTQIQPEEQKKFDLKRTQIGGGGGTPMLMVSVGNFAKNFPLNKPQMTIGRNPGNDIIIPDNTVSGSHATIINENGNWVIIDNNSTNGTFVNGTKINKQRVLPTDMIKLGAAFVKLQI